MKIKHIKFKDANLEQAIKDTGFMDTREVIELRMAGYDIRYLDGLECFTKLESLYLNLSTVVSFEPLGELAESNLKWIHVEG